MKPQISRRNAFQLTGAAALAGVAVPLVHAGVDDTIQLALIGCGGRGTGAIEDAMSAQYGPTKLVAMADVFQGKLDSSYSQLSSGQFKDRIDVAPERKFIGFDGFKKAMDSLKPGDIAILTTPPAFRWVQFQYAIEKGLNVFMEKPVSIDGPSTRRMLKLGEEAAAKNLKVAVGLMCRHCRSRGELAQRIKDGQLGQITMLRCYRQHGPQATCFSKRRPANVSELDYQIQRFHSFLWASGGVFSDFNIHNIDECCWMKDAWPVSARGSGGRHFRGDYIDQNFDTYSVEYTFADGSKLWMEARNIAGCAQEFASYAHGTKGSAVISQSGHAPSKARIFADQNMAGTPTWKCATPEPNPYVTEWDDFLQAIRRGEAYNEVKRGAEASLVTAMGRKSAHTGQVVTFDEMMKDEFELGKDIDQLTAGGPAPLREDADGKYPVPEPGRKKKAEF